MHKKSHGVARGFQRTEHLADTFEAGFVIFTALLLLISPEFPGT